MSYYAEHNHVVEVASSFYHAPSRKVVEGWRDKTPAGFGFWLTLVATEILESGEAETDVIENYYETYLRRPGDPEGIDGWLAALQSGESEEAVLASFVGSAEYVMFSQGQ